MIVLIVDTPVKGYLLISTVFIHAYCPESALRPISMISDDVTYPGTYTLYYWHIMHIYMM